MWLLIDNYDSFTHILHHYLLHLHSDIVIVRNDKITIAEIIALAPERIIISPGPQTPQLAGITMAAIARFHQTTPILGICLGHQALGEFFGGKLQQSARPFHGKTSVIKHDNSALFKGLPSDFKVMRYHSLIITEWENTAIRPLAFTENKELMAMQISGFPCVGIQFHPESILTEHGRTMLQNWDIMCNEKIW